MAVTMVQVRAVLDPEEPDYEQAAKLGPRALPHLETLVNEADTLLASAEGADQETFSALAFCEVVGWKDGPTGE